MFVKENYNLIVLIKYILFSLPIIYLLKLNFATTIISLSPLFFILFKSQVKLNYLSGSYLLFFLYLFIHSLFYKNLDGIYFLRYIFFLLIFITFIKFEDFKALYNFLLIAIIIIVFDLLIQYFFGINLFGYSKNDNFFSSFFNDEKILGTYVFKIYLLMLITSFLINDKKTLKNTIYFFPLIILLVAISGQRNMFINSIILSIILSLYIFGYKKILSILSFVFLILITLIILNQSILKINIIGRTVSVFQGNKILPIYNIYNSPNYEKVVINKKVIEKPYFKYEDIFAYGYINNHKEELSLKKFINDQRVKDYIFSFCVREFNDNCIKEPSILELKNNFNLIESKGLLYKNLIKNERIVEIYSTKLFKTTLKDTGWYAHSRIAIEMWKKNFFFGVGLKNYRDLCYSLEYNYFESLASQYCPSHPHHYIAEILGELGIIGALIVFIMILSVFYVVYGSTLSSKKKITLYLLIILFFQFWLPTGRFFSSNESFYFMYLTGILFVYRKKLFLK